MRFVVTGEMNKNRLLQAIVLAFHEPSEYQPSERWLAQLDGKRLGPDLQLKRDIQAIAGATLSSQSVTRAVRTALALYQVLIQPSPAE